MNKNVVWSARAKKDLLAIKAFYDKRNGNTTYSSKLLRLFRKAAGFIEKFPKASAKTDFEEVRGFIILDYTLFYEETDRHILILTVWDNRRDPAQIRRYLEG